MYGDTELMRRRARDLREQATEIRAGADGLVARTEAVAWTGRAADAMRDRVRQRATQLRQVAVAHETAADSLDVHLAEVTRLQDAIELAQRRADSLAPGGSPGFDPPPPGHRDWLAVDLPGL
ncbi:MAG: hypothetical protein U0R80_14180 [Nocardioidaceae bacterium]